jgi:23S rRNA C2498 (ribose-2'-O)-methylase RlmM
VRYGGTARSDYRLDDQMAAQRLVSRDDFQFEITDEKALSRSAPMSAKLTDDLTKQGLEHTIQAKHLFHDREEITVHVLIKSKPQTETAVRGAK